MVSLGGGKDSDFDSTLAFVLTSFCHRPLEPFCQTKITLDSVPFVDSSASFAIYSGITDFANHFLLPHLLTPQQALRWSDLRQLLSWQLWLARQLVIDRPLPWQKPQTNLTFGRVAQGFASLLVRIGSPACSPNPRGKSLGWKSGLSELLFLAFPSLKNALLVQKMAIKTTLIPNLKYSPLHSLEFAQSSILWGSFSCSFSRFLNQLSLDSSSTKTRLNRS